MLRNKIIPSRYSPYPCPRPLRQIASTGRVTAHGGADDNAADGKRPPPRVHSAPAQLQGLDGMANAGQSDLVDAAYFAPPTPGRQLGDDGALGAVGPNALSLRVPHAAGAPHVGADIDRGGFTLNEESSTASGNIGLNGTRNIGGSVVGGSFDAPLDSDQHHAKLALNAVSNGQTVALAPSVAFHDMLKDELGLGMAVFGSARSDVRVLPAAAGAGVAIESRHAASKGFAFDPRVAWAPVWAGAFFKMAQSQVDETLFRLSVTKERAGALLARQQSEGPGGFFQNWLRQWSQVTRNQPSVRQPDLLDPFGDGGGRAMRPGQTLTRHRSQTRVMGAGAGFMGVRAGRYSLQSEETQITVRCLDDAHVALVISPRQARAVSNNVDSPLGPNLQGVKTRANGALTERFFNLRDAKQKEIYQQLVRGDALGHAQTQQAPEPYVKEEAKLVARDEAKGVLRIPFETSWGGFGEHLSRQEIDVSRDEHGRLSQSREVVAQTTQHALEQGRNSWRINAASRGSSISEPNLPGMLAFRGLSVTTERSATRPDLAMRNVMTAEHARLWRKELPAVTDGPRNDYKIIATTVFSGRQLGALEKAMPERAAQIAQACGAAPEPLIALIGALRNANRDASPASPFAQAWRRSAQVGDYLQEAGAAGVAALHRLLGGPVDVRTASTVYDAPLQALEELKYAARPSAKKARNIAEQLRGSLRAAHADVILRAYNGEQWLNLIAKLERGLQEADSIASL